MLRYCYTADENSFDEQYCIQLAVLSHRDVMYTKYYWSKALLQGCQSLISLHAIGCTVLLSDAHKVDVHCVMDSAGKCRQVLNLLGS